MGIIKHIIVLLFFSVSVLKAQNETLKKAATEDEKEVKVLVMLPFCFGMQDKYRIREKMLEYYEGVEIAIAELRKLGVKMSIEIVDTKSDSLEVINILSNPEYQKVDAIFGPVYDSEFIEVQKFCSIYNIPLISPLRYVSNMLGADFPLMNFIANDSIQFNYIGQHVVNAFKKFQVIVVDESYGTVGKGSFGRNFKKGYESLAKKECILTDGKTPISELWNQKDSLFVFYTGKNSNACNKALAANGHNKWKVAGPADWLDIDRINYTVFENVYFYDQYCVPYNDTTFKVFRKNYREHYGGDPQRYTLIGYDQFLFFGTAIAGFKNSFFNAIQNKEFNYLHTTFNFVSRGNLIENAGVNLFYFKNYNFYKAYWRY